jgi:hypothetical protein
VSVSNCPKFELLINLKYEFKLCTCFTENENLFAVTLFLSFVLVVYEMLITET